MCGCGGRWKGVKIFNKSKINDKHGQIGWVCTLPHEIDKNRIFDVMENAIGYCECFIKRKDMK